MSTSRDRRRGDHGQVTTALVLIVSTALLSIGLVGIVLIGRGVDEKSKAQTAADAAALAAAGAVTNAVEGILGALTALDLSFADHDLTVCGTARDAAARYAAENGAELDVATFECSLLTGVVEVDVTMRQAAADGLDRARASATAETGLSLGGCGITPPDPPETAEPEEPEEPEGPGDGPTSPTTPPPPPPDRTTTLDCGPLHAEVEIDGETGQVRVTDIEISVEPRLVD